MMQQDTKNTLKPTKAECFLKEDSNLISLGKFCFPVQDLKGSGTTFVAEEL